MRVLHLLKTSTGADWAYAQMSELKKLGVDVEVVLPSKGKMSARYEADNIPIHYTRIDMGQIRNPVGFLRSAKALRKLVAARRPDIIHSHFVSTTLFARAVLGRNHSVPRIFQVPGPLHLEHALTRMAEIWSAGNNDHWIASCNLTKQIYLAHGIAPEKVGLSFYGKDTAAFSVGKRGKLRAELDIPSHTKIVGMVAYAYKPKKWLGQRQGIKGHEDLIRAVEILLGRGRDVVLVIVGGPWQGAEAYFGEIKNLASQRLADKGKLLGTRHDVSDIYADFDIAVHPSHSENLGGAAESLLAGIPTVATRIGGFPDIVIDGKTGLLCDPKNPMSLANALDTLLLNPAKAVDLAQAGQAFTKSVLDVSRTSLEIYNSYKRIVGVGN